ncbi:MAG: response regulator [Pseudomonadota bacterium]
MAFFKRFKRSINTVLIVEDEPLVAFDNELHLGDAGYSVVATVDSAADALATIARDKPDMVVTDVRLSGEGDGVDVARAAHDAHIPVIFVTGACPLEAQKLAAGCLVKPYGPRDLVRAVETVDSIIRGEAPAKIPQTLTLYHSH